jgi:hypothetical protein
MIPYEYSWIILKLNSRWNPSKFSSEKGYHVKNRTDYITYPHKNAEKRLEIFPQYHTKANDEPCLGGFAEKRDGT